MHDLGGCRWRPLVLVLAQHICERFGGLGWLAVRVSSHGAISAEQWSVPDPTDMEQVELEFWSWMLWTVAAVLKFLVTPSAMVAAGFGAWTAWWTTSVGASLGVAGFWSFGKWLFKWLEEKMGPRPDRGKKVFTPQRRRIVRLKNTMGWKGLLLVSGIISVPLAVAIGAKYFRDIPGARFQLMLAFAVWSAMLTFLSWTLKAVAF